MPAHVINGRFQILLRRRQNMAIYPLPTGPFINVIVQCDPLTGAAQYLPGDVDNATAFACDVNNAIYNITPVDGWYDFTNYIEGDEKLSFTWDKTNTGDSKNSAASQDGSNYDKGITSDLLFFDCAGKFIENWLLATECQILNCVEVKIIDLVARANFPDPAGNYRIFEIKSDNIEYSPIDEPCQYHVRLREQDGIWHCIHKTVIWDDWQGWFNSTGTSTFQHPTFLTCIEQRPRLMQSVRLGLMTFLNSFSPIALAQAIVDKFITGQDPFEQQARRILETDRFVDAPFIRTYIQNVALKCEMTWDTIFDEGQDWENLCLYYPQAGTMYQNDDEPIVSPSQAFTYENRWLVTLADLMDKLKLVFCAEWYVTPLNKIVFKYTKDLITLAPIYDYTAVGAEPIYGLHYSFNGDKKPAYGVYQYAPDGSDLASQEIDTLYSDIVDFSKGGNNPMLEGDKTKSFEFAATGFVRDGRSKDYLKVVVNDSKVIALIMVLILGIVLFLGFDPALNPTNAAVFIGLLAIVIALAIGVASRIAQLRNTFIKDPIYTGAVRLTCEQVMTPRLLLWDGTSMQCARVEARMSYPIPNPYYNPAPVDYGTKNEVGIDNDDPFGLYNYPLYIDGDFYGNLFQYHDPIDNPLKSIETHQTGHFCVDLCTEQLNLYGVFQDQYAQIGKIVKVEQRAGYDVYIRVGNINVDYDSNKICISGNVIRHPSSSVDVEGPGNIPPVIPSASEPPPAVLPDDVCYALKNIGTTVAIVTYKDCFGVIVTGAEIFPTETFCAIELHSVTGGNIVATDTCVPTEESGVSGGGSGSSGGGGTGTTNVCVVFINLRPGVSENISYIDCNGVLVAGVSIPFLGTVCGFEIVTPGCSTLVSAGVCEPCADCCLPEFISATTSTEPPPEESGSGCVPIELEVSSMPDAFIDNPYSFVLHLYGTPPFAIETSGLPAWMSVEIVDDTLVFSGTPTTGDEGTGIEITATISNDCGTADFADTIDVIVLGEFIIEHDVDLGGTLDDGSVSILPLGNYTGYVDWGDGTFEPFTMSALVTINFFHSYAVDGVYERTFYFDTNAHLAQFAVIVESAPYTIHFSHSDNFTLFNGQVVLQGVSVVDITDVFPPAASNITTFEISGGLDLTTTMDFSTLVASVDSLYIQNFGVLTTITNIPSTINNTYNISGCPLLTAVNSGGSMPTAGNQQLSNNADGIVFGTLDLSTCATFTFAQDFSVSQVNAFLVALDANGIVSGDAYVRQAPDAVPTGAGVTAAANLVGKAWNVITDPG